VTADWDDDWDEIEEDDLAGTPYVSTAYYLQECEMNNCKANEEKYLFCAIDELCERKACEHDCFCNYQMINTYRRAIADAKLINNWAAIKTMYAAIVILCNCSPCSEDIANS